MGQAERKGYKRLPPPIVVEWAHVAPPACVSVGGAIPVSINSPSISPTATYRIGRGRPHACMCWCE